MAATTLPRALRIILNVLAWASLPMLGLTIASAFAFPVRADRTIDAVMLLCAMCALTRVVQAHQDARLRLLTETDDAHKRALIAALDAKAGPSTGPIRLLRDAS